ncbi:alpha-galactosidase [Pseudoxanthomonas sacheonensis]|nr:alpha-galactosidase [Pseudoxanthomonas sacheonensis]
MLLASALAIRPALALEEPADDAQPTQTEPPRTMNGLATTPPMGWNSWNKFACNVDEKLIRRMADAMVSSGMRDVGYRYIVIDDCWHGERDSNGFIQADPKRFPSGMKALGDYIHAKGLKFGIYSDAGRKTCGGRPGSQGYEFQDALQYARWGVDYLKYDWCNTGTRNAQEAYTLMADALRASGRDIVFSLCEWGGQKPWLWGRTVGNLWRTTGDIYDKWQGRHKYMLGMLDIVDINEPLWPYAGPGHWNDPDMLEVGNGGMTETEYRTHFSLWAIMAAPLIAGNDLSRMDGATRRILLNREVIAVNQDALGAQGRRVAKNGDQEIWVKPLADGARAVLLFNRGERPAEIGVGWEQLGYPRHLSAHLRDLWTQQDLPAQVGRYAAMVEPHAAVMLVVRP